ncbi:MAG: DUF523 domain-containing protein [Bacillota bacterium]
MEEQKVVMVSGCLLGLKCRFDGAAKKDPSLMKALQGYRLVPFCPETLGGLPIPRPPAEIFNGDGAMVLAGGARVINLEGRDCTAEYLQGAQAVLRLVLKTKPLFVILKAKSPSCGVGQIYDGSFSGLLRPGDGVTTAVLRQAGMRVFSELEAARPDFPIKLR